MGAEENWKRILEVKKNHKVSGSLEYRSGTNCSVHAEKEMRKERGYIYVNPYSGELWVIVRIKLHWQKLWAICFSLQSLLLLRPNRGNPLLESNGESDLGRFYQRCFDYAIFSRVITGMSLDSQQSENWSKDWKQMVRKLETSNSWPFTIP